MSCVLDLLWPRVSESIEMFILLAKYYPSKFSSVLAGNEIADQRQPSTDSGVQKHDSYSHWVLSPDLLKEA